MGHRLQTASCGDIKEERERGRSEPVESVFHCAPTYAWNYFFFSPILRSLQEFNFLQFLILYLGLNDPVCLLSVSIKQNNGLLKFPMVFYDFSLLYISIYNQRFRCKTSFLSLAHWLLSCLLIMSG